MERIAAIKKVLSPNSVAMIIANEEQNEENTDSIIPTALSKTENKRSSKSSPKWPPREEAQTRSLESESTTDGIRVDYVLKIER